MKDLELIYNARAGHIDLGHQYFFFYQTTVVWRNSSELNYQIPHAKQNDFKHSFYYIYFFKFVEQTTNRY